MELIKQKSLRDVESLFDHHAEATHWSSGRGRVPVLPESWSPHVDVYETEGEFLIKAEIPDVRREDVSVKVDGDVITISGERRLEQEEEGTTLHRIERYYGCFFRRFLLPADAEGTQVKASFKDGILGLHIPKKSAAGAADVEVKID